MKSIKETFSAADKNHDELLVERSIECGGVRLLEAELQRWRTADQLANWLEWCAKEIRTIDPHPLTNKTLRAKK